MSFEFDCGLNLIKKIINKGLEEFDCDEIICFSFNINLDLLLSLYKKYPKLVFTIYSNSEKIHMSKTNLNDVFSLIEKGKLHFFHISENINFIHAKILIFKKENEIIFIAIGSPNFTESSNQNFESIFYIFDRNICNSIVTRITNRHEELNFNFDTKIPIQLEEIPDSAFTISDKYLDGLWAHQKQILNWISSKQTSIINVPPGVGKTEIAIRYMKYLFENQKKMTIIVLVPTITLINQWKNRLSYLGLKTFELKSGISDLDTYLANPSNKILITLYSRFYDNSDNMYKDYKINKQNIMVVYDECHNLYGNIDKIFNFKNLIKKYNGNFYELGLSATLESFNKFEQNQLINYVGGNRNIFEISLQSFYVYWNTLNKNKILKSINYIPIRYNLNEEEMEKYKKYSKKIAIQMGKIDINQNEEFSATIERARWLRSLSGGICLLKDFIIKHFELISKQSTIMFVQTHELAEELQNFIVKQPGWNPESSVYIYDSYKSEEDLIHSLKQFKENMGYVLISERMLSEGFDLPKVDMVFLHGSHTSPRDWIQKIGRALRYNVKDPNSIAQIVDLVVCDVQGEPLPLEKERYECLTSIG